MKRYLIVCVLLTFLIPCMVVPASATTQGVIDQLEDLQQGLGTSQRDILDAIERIETAIYDWYTDWVGTVQANVDFIATEIAEAFPGFTSALNSLKSSMTTLVGFFKTTSPTVKYYTVEKITTGFRLKQTGQAPVTQFEYVLVSMENALLNAYVTIANGFYSLLSGDTTASDEFEEDMTPIETEVDEWIDSMETAPTINVDDIETEVDKVTDFETDANYISILSSIFLNEAFLMMFTWCVILAMLGFILYGKR